jgi:hypothetical protein
VPAGGGPLVEGGGSVVGLGVAVHRVLHDGAAGRGL